MRRIQILLYILFCFSIYSIAETREITVSFLLEDFEIKTEADGLTRINSRIGGYNYANNNDPGLPLKTVTIAVPKGSEFESVVVNLQEVTVGQALTLVSNPLPIESEDTISDKRVRKISYSEPFYPNERCRFTGKSEFGDLSLFNFTISPFCYKTNEGRLDFAESMILDIKFNNQKGSTKKVQEASTVINDFQLMLAKLMAKRVEDTESKNLLNSMVVNYENQLTSNELQDAKGRVEYLIITNQALKNSFVDLAQWKSEKGVPTKIVATEQIYQVYPNIDSRLAIKKFIYDQTQIHPELKFVMLGGDDSVVPARGCYGKVMTSTEMVIDMTIPTDLYYSCFEGNFEWDGNHNGIFGETDDDINTVPQLCVTRLPVKSISDVEAYTEKLLAYEKNPIYHNNLLMVGAQDGYRINKDGRLYSLPEIKGDWLYNDRIREYWNGITSKFYDTYTDFDGGSTYQLTGSNLSKKISDGYSFINIISEGTKSYWSLENDSKYSIILGSVQENECHSFITSATPYACSFDHDSSDTQYPSLIEILLRSRDNNILGCYGSSRESWELTSRTELGTPFLNTLNNYYNILFADEATFENYGIISLFGKLGGLNTGGNSDDNLCQWLKYSINILGDPEIPVFINEPQHIKDLSIKVDRDGGLYIDLQEISCLSIMEGEYYNPSYYRQGKENNSYRISDLPLSSNICISRHGYIPRFLNLQIIQNKNFTDSINYECGIAVIGENASCIKPAGPVIFNGGTSHINAEEIIFSGEVEVTQGTEVMFGQTY